MATLKELNLRIGSLKSTRKITQAMKLISTTKLNRFQSKVRFTINYHRRLNEIFNKVVAYTRTYPDVLKENPLWTQPRGHKALILLFTSDRGLCGSFNSNAIKAAQQLAMRLQGEGKEVTFDCYGKKGYDFLRRREYTIGIKHDPVFREVYEEEKAQTFSQHYLDGFLRHDFQELYLVYNAYISAISQKPHITKVLPFDINTPLGLQDEKSKLLQSKGSEAGSYSGLFEPDLDVFVENLVKKFIRFEFYFAYLNSATGEHATRMTSMDSATKNGTDMIDLLTLERNRVRQAAITKELIEIISGAESV